MAGFFLVYFQTFLGFWERQNDAETENTIEYSDETLFLLVQRVQHENGDILASLKRDSVRYTK